MPRKRAVRAQVGHSTETAPVGSPEPAGAPTSLALDSAPIRFNMELARQRADAVLRGFATPLSPETIASLQARIDAAAVSVTYGAGQRAVRATDDHKALFLLWLGTGLPIAVSAALTGVTADTMYRHRRQDKEFAEAWDDALEASLAPIEERMSEIAINGNPESMATVRAAELMLRRRSRTFQPPKLRPQGVEVQLGQDGKPSAVRFVTSAPLPD